jgi:hypothetical protein
MTADIDLKAALTAEFKKVGFGWDVKGVIDSAKRIYTVTDDTKLISKVFELISFPVIAKVAKDHGFAVVPSDRQTVYPDITLQLPGQEDRRIAIDVKSTYRKAGGSAGFTLGSYTAYLRRPTKNIVFPYDTYATHWIVGFIYSRNQRAEPRIVGIKDLDEIEPAIKDIEIIIQEKWRIASARPGSGNTANIGSVTNIEDLRKGTGPFVPHGEATFLDYWRNYISQGDAKKLGQTQPYNSIEEYLTWRREHPAKVVEIPEQTADQLALSAEANDVPHEESDGD